MSVRWYCDNGIRNKFSSLPLENGPLTFEQKVLVKQNGQPTPDLYINYSSSSKTRTYNSAFNKNIYDKYKWICGCPVTNKLFCFVCILFRNEITAWTRNGVDDLKHIADRAKKHEKSSDNPGRCSGGS